MVKYIYKTIVMNILAIFGNLFSKKIMRAFCVKKINIQIVSIILSAFCEYIFIYKLYDLFCANIAFHLSMGYNYKVTNQLKEVLILFIMHN